VKQIINFGLGPEDANLLISAQKIDYKVQFSGRVGWSDRSCRSSRARSSLRAS